MASKKTLPPSAQKLLKARQDGDVAKSRDLSTSILLTLCYLYLFCGGSSLSRITSYFSATMRSLKDFDSNNMIVYAAEAGLVLFEMLGPILGLLFLSAFAAEACQVGIHVSFKSMQPNLAKLNFFKGLKKMFGVPEEGQGDKPAISLMYEVLKLLLLCSFSLGLLIVLIYQGVPKLARVDPRYSTELLYVFSSYLKPLFLSFLLALAGIGVFDLLFKRKQRLERLKMDFEELKKESRENEGDPELKGRRKQFFKESIAGRSIQAVRKAKVLVLGKRTLD